MPKRRRRSLDENKTITAAQRAIDLLSGGEHCGHVGLDALWHSVSTQRPSRIDRAAAARDQEASRPSGSRAREALMTATAKTDARYLMQAARTDLVMTNPFFGALSLRLKLVERTDIPTAAVDGVHLFYNAAFIESLTSPQRIGLFAHEVMHCACGHPWRRDARDPFLWNVAADFAINPVLVSAGFALPEGGLLDPKFEGKSAEWIFDRLPKRQKQQRSKATPGAGAPDVQDSPTSGAGGQNDDSDGSANGDAADGQGQGSSSDESGSEADWQRAVQEAATAAKARGSLPAGLARFAAEAVKPKVDWKSVLRRFIQASAKTDYTWRMPNRRYIQRGLYLPSLYSEAMGPIVVAVDTSGSIDRVALAHFEAELRAIVSEARPSRVHVVYADAAVSHVDVFEADEPITLKPKGGGGTSFVPAIDYADALDDDPACLVYLTDLDGAHRQQPPRMPVLWAVYGSTRHAPYGDVVPIE